MPKKNEAYHLDKTKKHGNAKWTKADIEAILADIRAGMKKGAACAKHGIKQPYFNTKLEQYHAGELQ